MILRLSIENMRKTFESTLHYDCETRALHCTEFDKEEKISTGTAWGYIESFLFWLIQDLGGSRSLMGITITVGGIAGIPLLALSGPIISKIGHANVLFIGFVFYAVRLLGECLKIIITPRSNVRTRTGRV